MTEERYQRCGRMALSGVARFPVRAVMLAVGLTVGLTVSAQATPNFAGYQIAGGWPTASVSAGAGWSSDLGVDYGFGLQDNGANPVTGVGQGSFTSSKPVFGADDGFDLRYALNIRGGQAGLTYSEGWLGVPTAGAVSPTQVFEFRLHSVLGANSGGYGIDTGAQIRGNFIFSNVADTDQIYFAMDWSGTVTAAGTTIGTIELDGVSGDQFNPLPRRPVVGVFAGNNFDIFGVQLPSGTQVLSGSDSGSFGNEGTGNGIAIAAWNFQTMLSDNAGVAGEGEIDMTVRIAFSSEAITSVPNLTGIPEPATLALFGAGLVALGARRRRAG